MDRRKLVILTNVLLLTLLVSSVGAILVATILGGPVKVIGVTATVEYATTNDIGATWTTSIESIVSGSAWWARLKTTATGYAGTVKITWLLEKSTNQGSTWTSTAISVVTASVSLSGATGQIIYASSDGTITNNKNWGADSSELAWYRVKATVETV